MKLFNIYSGNTKIGEIHSANNDGSGIGFFAAIFLVIITIIGTIAAWPAVISSSLADNTAKGVLFQGLLIVINLGSVILSAINLRKDNENVIYLRLSIINSLFWGTLATACFFTIILLSDFGIGLFIASIFMAFCLTIPTSIIVNIFFYISYIIR